MLRCCFPLFCASVSWDALFRRTLATQSIIIDLIPIKKPVIDGSISWFVEENIQIDLVSGVKGTSPDEVTEMVKRQAVRVLQQCGDGDAVKGCHTVKRCVEGAKTLRTLLRRLDIQARLRLWSQTLMDTSILSNVAAVTSTDTDEGTKQNCSVVMHCSVYMSDTWEPYCHERQITDVSTLSSGHQSWCELLREALYTFKCEVVSNSQQFALASYNEAQLLLSAVGRTTHDGVFSFQAGGTGEYVRLFVEDPLTRWLVLPTTYKLDFEFMRCERNEGNEFDIIAGSCVLRDDVGNIDQWDLPLVEFKDKAGLVYSGGFDTFAPLPLKQEPIEETILELLEDSGAISRVTSVKDSEFVPQLVHSLWERPFLQALLLQCSSDILCDQLFTTHAKDYVRSCGRLDIDMWLSERDQTTTSPMTPRCLRPFDALDFLRECLPLEFGARKMVPVSIGSLHFGYYVAVTSTGYVVTAASSFHSALSALSALLPWYSAMPLRAIAVDHLHRHRLQIKPKHLSFSKLATEVSVLPGACDSPTEQPVETRSLTVRVIDVKASLEKFGVVSGTFNAETVEYHDASGKTIFRFEQMDTLQGIERLVKRVRHSHAACFVSVGVVGIRRTPLFVSCRALAGLTPQKAPPYIKRIRIPVPLVPGAFFSLRFVGLLDMEQKEDALLDIFARYAEDPAQWPLRRLVPCFFNRWRLTRIIIEAILRHDPLFHYTLERATEKEKHGTFLLRFYSGDELQSEMYLEEKTFLQQARTSFAQHATRWHLFFPSTVDVTCAFSEIRKSFSSSYKMFVAALLQNSEITTQCDNTFFLELYIVAKLKIRLAEKPETSKELLGKAFLEQQFPELIPVVQLLQRACHFLLEKRGGKEMMFCCAEIGDGGRFRWELQDSLAEGSEVKVLGAAEGPSRFSALSVLMDKLDSQMNIEKPTLQKAAATAAAKYARTIEEYQEALACLLGVKKIIHEYDPRGNVLLVKSISRPEQSSEGDVKVIRVIPLGNEYTIGVVMHRYYRIELHLDDPPMPKDLKVLRVMSLSMIYNLCQQHFSLALPPLEDSLIVEQVRVGWKVVLRLPAKLFALGNLRYVDYVYCGAGKHEGKRNVLCEFYKALYGETPDKMRQHLSEVLCQDGLPIDKSSKKGLSTGVKENYGSNNSRITTGSYEHNTCKNDRKMVMVKTPCNGMDMSMYGEIVRIIDLKFKSHVDYEGVTEFRLSYITGFSGRYVPRLGQTGECVELFNAPLCSTVWLPLQLLSVLLTCACQLVSEEELETSLLQRAAAWPSLFLDATRGERLYCTTFLRRYLGLWTFEENDVGDRATVPGAMYLVESTRRVADKRFESLLTLVQTPQLSSSAVFKKVLASHKGATGSRAESGMWGDVARQLRALCASESQEDIDKAVFFAALKKCAERTEPIKKRRKES